MPFGLLKNLITNIGEKIIFALTVIGLVLYSSDKILVKYKISDHNKCKCLYKDKKEAIVDVMH